MSISTLFPCQIVQKQSQFSTLNYPIAEISLYGVSLVKSYLLVFVGQ